MDVAMLDRMVDFGSGRVAKPSHPIPLRGERGSFETRSEYHRFLRSMVPATTIAEPLAPDRHHRPRRRTVRRRCYGPMRLYNAVAFVQRVIRQSNGSGASTFTSSNALEGAVSAGNMLIGIPCCAQNKTITGFSSSVDGAFTLAIDGSSGWWKPGIFYLPNCSAHATNATFTMTLNAGADLGFIVLEFSGMGSTPTVSTTGTASQGSSSTSWGTCTSTGNAAASDLVINAAASDNNSGTCTISVGTSADDNATYNGGSPGKAASYVLSATAGSQSFSCTWGSAGDGGMVLACFTPSGGGGGGPTLSDVYYQGSMRGMGNGMFRGMR